MSELCALGACNIKQVNCIFVAGVCAMCPLHQSLMFSFQAPSGSAGSYQENKPLCAGLQPVGVAGILLVLLGLVQSPISPAGEAILKKGGEI